MEHIIGITVKDRVKGNAAFLTWGRVFGRTESEKLLNIIKTHLDTFNIHNLDTIEICATLQDVATYPYFYENFFMLCQEKIPFGAHYKQWQEEKRKAIIEGKEIYFLGFMK